MARPAIAHDPVEKPCGEKPATAMAARGRMYVTATSAAEPSMARG